MATILGISAFYHDSAACLIRDGLIVAAAQEERFSRVKYDPRFPTEAINYCLEEANITVADLDYVAFNEKPYLKFDRIIASHAQAAPFAGRSFEDAINGWIFGKLGMESIIRTELPEETNAEILFIPHHECHAAASFYPSQFSTAAILTVDAVGEWATTGIGFGKQSRVSLMKEMRFPHSLGLLYSAFTQYCGFRVNSGEYKLMGLAPYGKPLFTNVIRDEIVNCSEDGSFTLNLEYFDFLRGDVMTNDRFHRLFGGSPRSTGQPLEQRHMDMASSIQAVLEEILVRIAKEARRLTGSPHLCIGGGVALNCVANSRLLRENVFDELFVFPASGDAGAAVGAALTIWHQLLGQDRPLKAQPSFSPYLGCSFSDYQIKDLLDKHDAIYSEFQDETELITDTARHLADGKVVAWFQGRMEFGPRALGARSILGDPRQFEMQRTMNMKVKFRESFRPFAPAVLAERASDYFEWDRESPYMSFVANVKSKYRVNCIDELDDAQGLEKLKVLRSVIPAVTHVDFSARLQTVSETDNARFYRLLSAFEEMTGCGLIINTSFNIRGEPIVCTPEEAYRCFMFANIDVLVIGNCVLIKEDQPSLAGAAEYRKAISSDEYGSAESTSSDSNVRSLVLRFVYYLAFTPLAKLVWLLKGVDKKWREGGWQDLEREKSPDSYRRPF